MNYEHELKRLADMYSAQGYRVVVRPQPEDLPPFAKDFKVEIVGRRGNEGVLVAVKKNLDEAAADHELPRYAEVTGAQPGWRFDFANVQTEKSIGPEGRAVHEFSGDGISEVLASAQKMARSGFTGPAVTTAWAGLEAAMRMRLRAAGERAGWGTTPRVMLNELYSSGILTGVEFRRLETIFQLRNVIAHGFVSPGVDPDTVEFLADVAGRLMSESQQEKQPA